MGRFRSRLLVLTALAVLAGLAATQSAFGLGARVRVEAAPFTVCPTTRVSVPATGTFYDGAGTPYRPGYPSALGALAAASKAEGFSWAAAYGGNFITEIGGFSALPDWSQGWIYAVNGAGYPIVDVGALDLHLARNDTVLFAQSPDATFSRQGKALVVRFDEKDRAYETGQPVVVTVYADDLAKANSTTQADRFKVDHSYVETSSQFQPMPDATVHLGSFTAVTDGEGRVTLTDLGPGTYRVWAERDMDASSFYIRSIQRAVNVADPLAMGDLRATPDPFTPGRTVRFAFTLSRAATARYTVRTRSGKLIATGARRLGGGDVSLRWNGRDRYGRAVRSLTYRVRITATDTWGRTASPLRTSIRAR